MTRVPAGSFDATRTALLVIALLATCASSAYAYACRDDTWGIDHALITERIGRAPLSAMPEAFFWAHRDAESPPMIVRSLDECDALTSPARCIAFEAMEVDSPAVESVSFDIDNLQVVIVRAPAGSPSRGYRVHLIDTYSPTRANSEGASDPVQTFEVVLAASTASSAVIPQVVDVGAVEITRHYLGCCEEVHDAAVPLPSLPPRSAIVIGRHRGNASVQAVHSTGYGLVRRNDAMASSPDVLAPSVSWTSNVGGCALFPTLVRDRDPLDIVVLSFDGRQLEATATLRLPPGMRAPPRSFVGWIRQPRHALLTCIGFGVLALLAWAVAREG